MLRQAKEQVIMSEAGEKIAYKGFLPRIDIQADGTLNLRELGAWNGDGPGFINMGTADNPDMSYIPGVYRNHTYSELAVVSQPLYTGGPLQAHTSMATAYNQMSQL